MVFSWFRGKVHGWFRPVTRRPRPLARLARIRPRLEGLERRDLLSTFLVSNTADAGAGSLRQAILDSNSHSGLNTIDFSINGGDHFETITPLTPLPAITNPVILDGNSQWPIYGTAIEVSGAGGGGANGLTINAGNTTVKGFALTHWSGSGLLLQDSGGDTVTLCTLGTDPSGTVAEGNTYGVSILSGSNDLIGSLNGFLANTISGNTVAGVNIHSNGNQVVGNFIGTDATGRLAIPNQVGVAITGSSNLVGGLPSGNVISGNSGAGISISGGATNNQVQNNLIGTDLTATFALGNGTGVFIRASGNSVGASGNPNLIAGNLGDGVLIAGSNNQVMFNTIGTDTNGSYPIGNGNGVVIMAGSNNFIEHGLISANSGAGVDIEANDNLVLACYIGVNQSGTLALGNGTGVIIHGSGNHVGGDQGTGSNLISGNLGDGVSIVGNSNLVQGNNIGTDFTGFLPIPNFNGVEVFGSNNQIGGSVSLGNTISGNTNDGVYLAGTGNQVQSNALGLTDDTSGPLPNQYGVYIDGGSNNLIGDNLGDGNQIGGNTIAGIYVASSPGTVIQANVIGIVPDGDGIVLTAGSDNTRVDTGNVISGNVNAGLVMGSNGNVVQNCVIGASGDSSFAIPNNYGIYVTGSNNLIGGPLVPFGGNIISGNTLDGIYLGGNGNIVQGNLIGIGNIALPNGTGMVVTGSNNQIGGDYYTNQSNWIGFNQTDGIQVEGGTGNAILGNEIYGHNNGLGIDLLNGGNNNVMFPVLTSAVFNGYNTTITGTLSGRPNTTYTLEFFDNPVPNPSGYGEGTQYIGSKAVTTDATGHATFSAAFVLYFPPGDSISATATSPVDGTSGFSLCIVLNGTDAPGAVGSFRLPVSAPGQNRPDGLVGTSAGKTPFQPREPIPFPVDVRAMPTGGVPVVEVHAPRSELGRGGVDLAGDDAGLDAPGETI
jgi:titin